MVKWTDVFSYEEALIALGNEKNAISIPFTYEGFERSFSAFAKALARNSSCTHLSLWDNAIGPEGAKEIAIALKENTSLSSLILRYNSVGPEGAKEIADALKHNSSLTLLDLSWNKIGPEGAKDIADALKANTSLTSLDLSWNKIGPEGAKYIADALKVNTSLTSLDLAYNSIGDKGAKEVTAAILENNGSTLRSLNLDSNGIEEAGKKALIELQSIRPIEISVVDETEVEQARKALAEKAVNEMLPYGWCKLMVIGEGRAGKTQTIRSLVGDQFQKNSESTAGGDIKFIHADTQFTKIEEQDRNERNNLLVREAAEKVAMVDTPKRNQTIERRHVNSNDDSVPIVRTTTVSEPAVERSREKCIAQLKRKSLYDTMQKVQKQLQNKKRLHFTMWDFGGQDVYKAVHHLFLTDGGLYLLVFDMSKLVSERDSAKSIEDLAFWVKSVRMYSSNPRIVFVGTHLDQCTEGDVDIVNKKIKKILLEEGMVSEVTYKGLYYYPVDNGNKGRTKKTFVEIRKKLVQIANGLKSVTQKVPMKWVLFLSSLWDLQANPDTKTNYMSLEELQAMQKEFSIEGDNSEEFLQFCHRMGMILHWGNVNALKETVVLNPQFIIDAAARVMHVAGLHGRILDQKLLEDPKLESDYNKMQSTGFISSELLDKVLWGDQQFQSKIDFLKELFKVTLLMSDYEKEEKVGKKGKKRTLSGFIVPSLLRNMGETDAMSLRKKIEKKYTQTVEKFEKEKGATILEAKLVFDWLPEGLFERLGCVCAKVGPSKRNKLAPEMILFYVSTTIGNIPILLKVNEDELLIRILNAEVPALSIIQDIKLTIDSILQDEMKCKIKDGEIFLLGIESHSFLFNSIVHVAEGDLFVEAVNNDEEDDDPSIDVEVKYLGAWREELLRHRDIPEIENGTKFVYKDLTGRLSPDEFVRKLGNWLKDFEKKETECDAVLSTSGSTVVECLKTLMDGPIALIARIWQDALKHASGNAYVILYRDKVRLFLEDTKLKPEKKIHEGIQTVCEKLKKIALERRYGIFISHQGNKKDQNGFAISLWKEKVMELSRKYQKELRLANGQPVPVFFDSNSMVAGDDQVESMLFSAYTSDQFIALIDRDYCTKKWCLMEFFLACHGHGTVRPFLLDAGCFPVSLPDGKVYKKGFKEAESDDFLEELQKHFGSRFRTEYINK